MTPKRCCSSMITKPSCLNRTRLLHERMGPHRQLRVTPSARRSHASLRSFAPIVPVSSTGSNRDGSSRRAMFRKCCSASSSVGDITAACSPFSIATSAASSATMVLPEPTSPCSRRFIGRGRCRSSTISLSACRWSPVRRNGSTSSAARRIRSSTAMVVGLAQRVGLAPLQRQAELKHEELLEDQPPLGRRPVQVEIIQGRPRFGKVRPQQRGPAVEQAAAPAHCRRQRIADVPGKPLQAGMHDAPRHLRRHASHPLVDRHYPADVHALISVVRCVPGEHLVVGIRELQAAAGAAAVDRAEQRDLPAGRQHVRQERLVEENRPHLARRVADHRLEDPESAPLRAPLAGAQHGAEDRYGVAPPAARRWAARARGRRSAAAGAAGDPRARADLLPPGRRRGADRCP